MAYTYYSPDPLTLVVDIPEMDTSALSSRIDVGTPEVESLRLTQMARGGRPQPGAHRGPPREPRAVPDLLEGSGLASGLRADG